MTGKADVDSSGNAKAKMPSDRGDLNVHTRGHASRHLPTRVHLESLSTRPVASLLRNMSAVKGADVECWGARSCAGRSAAVGRGGRALISMVCDATNACCALLAEGHRACVCVLCDPNIGGEHSHVHMHGVRCSQKPVVAAKESVVALERLEEELRQLALFPKDSEIYRLRIPNPNPETRNTKP
eukprot:2654398-Rhodomonas_salina.2